MRTVTIRPWRKYKADKFEKVIEVPDDFQAPLIISCGMGTDSVFMLHKAYRASIKPDLVMFADTGGERARTYRVVSEVRKLLWDRWQMDLTIVSRTDVYPLPSHEGAHTYTTLEQNCLDNKVMPSLAYRGHSCSLKWKIEPMERWVEMYYEPAMVAWELGMRVTKWIGYDASLADMKRSKISGDERYKNEYPIRDAGETRVDCIASIEDEMSKGSCVGQPGKSSCFFCPACKTHELLELYESEPEKLASSLLIENTALEYTLQTRTKPVTVFGLGGCGTWNWNAFMQEAHPEILAKLDAKYDTGKEKRAYILSEFSKRSEHAQESLDMLEPRYAQWRDGAAKIARSIIKDKDNRDVGAVAEAVAFIEEYKELQKSLPQLRAVAKGLEKTRSVVADYLAGIREEVSGGGF